MGNLGVDVATTSTGMAKPSVWDTINNVLTKVVQPAANVYTQVVTKTPGATAPFIPQPGGAYPQVTDQSPPPPAAEPDNTKKYLLIGGAVIIVGTTIYFIAKPKRKGKK